MKVDNKIVLSDIGVTYKTIEFSDKAINKLKIISTKKNIEKIFKLIGKLLVTSFCITVIYVSFSL